MIPPGLITGEFRMLRKWCPAYSRHDAVQALCRNYGNRSSQCQERNTITEIMSMRVSLCETGAELFVWLGSVCNERGAKGQRRAVCIQPNCRQEEAVCEQTKTVSGRKLHVVEAYRRIKANAGVDNRC